MDARMDGWIIDNGTPAKQTPCNELKRVIEMEMEPVYCGFDLFPSSDKRMPDIYMKNT
jgi:hypothetical protein